MTKSDHIIGLIIKSVSSTSPGATLILYGSYARSDQNEESDIDILILVDKSILSREDVKKIKYPLYDIEIDTGTIISPVVFSKSDWEQRHSSTPFYENIKNEGIILR
ncbi:MAG: nucleotidyltransferase domain-containing protein [Bacteroidales bacterium]|jgi:predicted nucleotidyltransferase|nr:nucleotidyltransferase domain-containing protein [Bacteroidales bacterium]